MRIALYQDSAGRGHYIDFHETLALAAIEGGHLVLVACPEEPRDIVDHEAVTWRKVPNLVATAADQVAAARAASAGAFAEASAAWGAEVVIDVDFTRQFTATEELRRAGRTKIHISHTLPPIRSRWRRSRGGSLELTRRDLRDLAKDNQFIVVHTDGAADRLRRQGAGASVIRLPLPVRSTPELPSGTLANGRQDLSVPALMFVGVVRAGKGFETVIRAVSDYPEAIRLSVVGKQKSLDDRPSAAGHCTIQWKDRVLTRQEMLDNYQSHDVVLVTHDEGFIEGGAMSLSLLEAVECGSVVVASDFLVRRLADERVAGVVPFRAGDPISLRGAIATALEQHSRYRALARTTGREAIHRNHDPLVYLNAMLERAVQP